MNKRFNGNYGVFCCPHVFEAVRPTNLVVRSEDGDWQFLCGGSDHEGDCHFVCVSHLLNRDPTLEVAADLGTGRGMERNSAQEKWRFFDFEEDEED